MTPLALFLSGFMLSCILTGVVKKIALALDITDKPTEARKIHAHPIPLMGGLGIYCAFAVILLTLLSMSSLQQILIDRHVTYIQIMGMLVGGLILTIGGILDDIYNLKPVYQIISPILACIVILASGIGIKTLTNPFGGTINLTQDILSSLLTCIWLMTAIYTTKFLDGLDGLVSGITVIGSIIILLLSLYFFINIPTVTLASVITGIFAGFLVWNFHPAKIFLGEAGSTLAGYFLGVLAIISGAKLATALLILGIPILDAAHVIFRRLVLERRSPFKGDRKHIHFRLYDMGCTQPQAVMILYGIAAFFGIAALFLQSSQKVSALVVVLLLMILLTFAYNKKNTADNN